MRWIRLAGRNGIFSTSRAGLFFNTISWGVLAEELEVYMGENWTAGEISDKNRIQAFLETDRLYAAYALGDLEPELYAQCAWAGAERDGQLRALGLQFRGFTPPAFFLMGDKDGLRTVLESALHPGRAYLTCREEHVPAVSEYYSWENEPDAMWRMVLKQKRFLPPARVCFRLEAVHIEQIRNLVALGGISGFAAAQIDRGVFYGIVENERLVSIAGTHLISPNCSVAAVGNVVTHPNFHGQGLGTAVVSAVLVELERLGIRDVVLNARQENAPAIHLYEKLGFERYCAFFEGGASIQKAGSAREKTCAGK
jgi:RimJ/RimL family protein N-acetyltransferase